jgi:RNA polymerase sigma-70 factor (ECF subfamily)
MAALQNEMILLIPHLRAFARSLASGDPSLADDLVQDTMLLALRACHQFTPGTNLKSWLLKILYNRFHSLRRRKHLAAEVAREDLEGLAWVAPSQDSRLEIAAFKQAMKALRPEHREALLLVTVHGLPYEEVAKVCGCAVGTVKSRVNRARQSLKNLLLGDGPAEASPRRSPMPPKAAPVIVVRTPPVPAASPAIVPATVVPVIPPLLQARLTEVERLIVRAEVRVTRCRKIAGHLHSAGLSLDAGGAVLVLAERHLADLHTQRQRLFEAG